MKNFVIDQWKVVNDSNSLPVTQ